MELPIRKFKTRNKPKKQKDWRFQSGRIGWHMK